MRPRRCWTAARRSATRTCWRRSAATIRSPGSCPRPSLELGALHESAGRLAEAAQAYKRLLAAAADDAWRARAIWSMARVYDAAQALRRGARRLSRAGGTLSQVRASSPGARPIAGPGRGEAGREPYVRLVADRRQPPLAPPMFRRWHWAAPADRAVRALSTEGVVPSLEASRIVLGDRDHLRLLDAADGVSRWSAELGSSAGLGRLPRRQADRRRPRPGRRARPGHGRGPVAISTRRRRRRTRTGPTRSPRPARRPTSRGARGRRRSTASGSSRAGSSACAGPAS